MIVVRDIFRIKFGQTKQATALWKQAIAVLKKAGYGKAGTRLLTDFAGPSYYTLVVESTFANVAEWEQAGQSVRNIPEWQSTYNQLIPLTETGHREILTVIE